MTPICDECGIRYEDDQAECPLCARRSPPQRGSIPEAHSARHFREVITFTAFSAGLLTFITDLAYSGSPGWSRIPLLSLGYAWLTMFLLSLARRAKYLQVMVAWVSTGGYLYFLSGLTGGEGWFYPTAISMVAAAAVISLLVTAVIRLFHMSFPGRVSTGLVGVALLTVCIDLILTPG